MRNDRSAHSLQYGTGFMHLVDGPFHGRRVSAIVARGRLQCEDGEYVHVEGGDDMCLYWIEWPVLARR